MRETLSSSNNDKERKNTLSFIKNIQDNLSEIQNVINEIRANQNDKNLYSKLNYFSEELALSTRKLAISENINSEKLFNFDDYADKNDEVFDVKIETIGTDIVKFTIPELLNSRYIAKSKQNKRYALPPKYFITKLKYAAVNYVCKNQYEVSENKKDLFVFNLVNNNERDSLIPDTDNREYKELFNLIKQYFIPDDSYKYVAYHLDTLKTNTENKTVLYLCSRQNLSKDCAEIIKDLKQYSQ